MIQGVLAAMMTPRAADGSLHVSALQEMTEFIIQNGAQGVFPVSNVGGMIHMTPQEKYDMVRAVTEQTRGRIPVFPGICASNTRDAIALGAMCAALHADGCVLSAPYYFPYPQSVVLEYLQSVVRRVQLPVVLYSIPKYAGEITLDSFRALLCEPNICAVKDSSGSLGVLLNLLRLRDEAAVDVSVFVGWEEMLLTALQAGAQGCMTASAGIFPEIMRAIETHYMEGNAARALRCQRIIAKATLAFQKVFFPLGYQWAMEARGIPMGAYPVTCDETALAQTRDEIMDAVHAALADFAALGREDRV